MTAMNKATGFVRAIARFPFGVSIAFGTLLGLAVIAPDVGRLWSRHVPDAIGGAPVGLAICFAAGLVGASRGRDFGHGCAAVIGTVGLASVVAIGVSVFALVATHVATGLGSAFLLIDPPVPGLILLGLPTGALGTGVACWLRQPAATAAWTRTI